MRSAGVPEGGRSARVGRRFDAEYVLPLRWSEDEETEDGSLEFAAYLRRLDAWIDVTVVDGSDPIVRDAHRKRWVDEARPTGLRLLPVEPWPGRNGKVAGVMTGIRRSRHERVVIADDDVRYDRDSLARVLSRLRDADVVRPQNVFQPLPWHARWDTARSLLARATGGDFPGTFALRRSTILRAGGYDGDVLFENLEMLRTVRAIGGVEARADDVFIERRPPTTRRFLEQRVRQAYDEWARPGHLAVELALAPLLVSSLRSPSRFVVAAVVVVAIAEVGRRRDGGRAVYPPSSALWAPVWLLERAVTSWLAVGARLRGGVPYRGRRLPTAAHSVRSVRARIAQESEVHRVA
ncbi:glycosyltransferase [Labedella phragmitis]|uniref:Glycosyltransferase n=1 Tax=Labedella phragmitis TaxID=2498849 RepID=A0A3S3ZQ82_9MICO|nr:glycosyltransferase [Labedella phragmitis]RWZ51145.1 glycosyltransferase [Labedella phragmitis]